MNNKKKAGITIISIEEMTDDKIIDEVLGNDKRTICPEVQKEIEKIKDIYFSNSIQEMYREQSKVEGQDKINLIKKGAEMQLKADVKIVKEFPDYSLPELDGEQTNGSD